MDEILAALAEQHAELGELLAVLDEHDWTRDTPCEGWTVADVVVHLAQTDELAIGSVRGRFDEAIVELAGDIGFADSIDAGADLMVMRDRDQSIAAVHDRWRRDADTLRGLLADRDLHDRVTWVAGRVVGPHARDDAARGVLDPHRRRRRRGRPGPGPDEPFAPHRAPRLADGAVRVRATPVASHRGPVAFELTGPDGEEWTFQPADPASTVIRGDGVELCLVAARRRDPRDTSLRGEGPDADAVLELVRTYA